MQKEVCLLSTTMEFVTVLQHYEQPRDASDFNAFTIYSSLIRQSKY